MNPFRVYDCLAFYEGLAIPMHRYNRIIAFIDSNYPEQDY